MALRTLRLLWAATLLLCAGAGSAQTVVDGSGEALPPAELAMVLRNLNGESHDPAAVQLRRLRRREGPPVILCGEIRTRDGLGLPTEFRTFAAVPEQDMVFSPFGASGQPFPAFDGIIRAHCGGS
ncbi:hypothetical protein M446_6375 [Methylobacterium sp. 4-46]|uniref:hypothetical protein n=1 Tax=unclassified Methylobacterium TaxID=2615210 RepID=UPI000152E7F7|nr:MULTISPECIES: hypothetical protein [Methylobacterium]ACA20639.1 hypothetical protein M446_6375 [Methylobacterium sp. 4-46]WFT79801.1 hypothetical protein QA634_32200 [Methylobacterium nodulans]